MTEVLSSEPVAWKRALRAMETDVRRLLEAVGLTPEDMGWTEGAATTFPCRVPARWLSMIRHGDPHDPLLRQVLPTVDEDRVVPGFTTDPLHEAQASPVPGLLHKYQGRVLLTMTGACALHCRYCFRRHYPYAQHQPSRYRDDVLAYVAERSDVEEVIFSGGDPLLLSDQSLASWLDALGELPHVQRVRFHSRVPSTLPERLTPGLWSMMQATRLEVVWVLHVNHPNELDVGLCNAWEPAALAKVRLLNQSVLLRGVNDSLPVLKRLSEALFSAGVLPYYLHLLDPVAGAAHFEVDPETADTLRSGMLATMPGYLVPRWVREDPSVPHKVPWGT